MKNINECIDRTDTEGILTERKDHTADRCGVVLFWLLFTHPCPAKRVTGHAVNSNLFERSKKNKLRI